MHLQYGVQPAQASHQDMAMTTISVINLNTQLHQVNTLTIFANLLWKKISQQRNFQSEITD